MTDNFKNQAKLMLEILSIISKNENDFALKGGTAINFFYQDMPRLSVDIDLTFLPLKDRNTTLKNISFNLTQMNNSILKYFPGANIRQSKDKLQNTFKLLVILNNLFVKIEPNLVVRSSVFPAETKTLSNKTQDLFNMYFETKVLSFADVYGGKICAALDRQHPRDLFDIKMLFDNGKITDDIKNAFIVYLVSHPRPIVEILNPNLLDISKTYESEFAGMTIITVTLKELEDIRLKLIKSINSLLTNEDKQFILSIKKGEPDFSLFPIDHINNLPSINWKLMNIKRMNKNKHAESLEKLKRHLKI